MMKSFPKLMNRFSGDTVRMILTTVYTCEDQEPKTISFMFLVYNVCRQDSNFVAL